MEHVAGEQEGRVLDDDDVRGVDRVVGADRLLGDPAEGDHRRAGPLGAEARERLRVQPLVEGSQAQQLGGRDHALATAPVDPHVQGHDAGRPTGVATDSPTSRTSSASREV